MGICWNVQGIIYYDSPSELFEVRKRLRDGLWLMDDDRWRTISDHHTPVVDEPATNFHPKAPALKIPYHKYRNFQFGKILENAVSGVLVTTCIGHGKASVYSNDQSWTLSLTEWGVKNGTVRKDKNGELYHRKYGYKIGEFLTLDTKMELRDSFHEEYAKLVSGLTQQAVQRVSLAELHMVARQTTLDTFDAAQKPVETKISDGFLEGTLGINTDVSPPDTSGVLPPDFAKE